MKAKVSFNSKAIKDFLLAHVEKFVFALIAVLMLFFVSGAMKRTGYERTPEELKNIADKAQQKIDSTPTPPEEERYVTKYVPISTRMKLPVETAGYQYQVLWTPFLWDRPPVRQSPMLFPLTELRATPGHGAVRVRITEGNPVGPVGGVEGQRWVVLTGLIPFKDQFEAYREAFKDAEYQDPERDIPSYIYYRVERAELKSPGEGVQPDWKPINLRARLTAAAQLWNGTGQEVVNPKYVPQGSSTPIVFPLPPLEDTGYGGFGREVVHDPEIPLAIEEEPEELKMEAEAPGAIGDDPLPEDLPDIPVESRVTVVEKEVEEEEILPFALFRFFDLEVEPGKHYQYRVKLLLANPNYEVERRFLAEDGLREAQWLETDWCDPTGVVTIPRDARVLLGSVKPTPGGRVTMEPKATVSIPYFHIEDGRELNLEEPAQVLRGRYLNFPNQEVPEPETRTAMMDYGSGEEGFSDLMSAPSRAPAAEDEETEPEKVNFNTETVLLDMAGGERLLGRDRDLTSPGMMLLLDPDGNLVVHDETDDKAEFNLYTPPEEKKTRKKDEPSPDEMYEEGSYEYEMQMMEEGGSSRSRSRR